jgi:hypothetical protein
MPIEAGTTEARLRASLAAHELHAQGKTNTGPARAARWQKLLDQVDPERQLSEEERTRRAQHAQAANMRRIALTGALKRRRRGLKAAAEPVE